jgi:hypothetical protein
MANIGRNKAVLLIETSMPTQPLARMFIANLLFVKLRLDFSANSKLKTRPVPAIQTGFAGCDVRQPRVAARFSPILASCSRAHPPQRSEMGQAHAKEAPTQAQQ